jgi:HD-GYP domain-containing protein (c-di-GMP phosphodiesterase class II)
LRIEVSSLRPGVSFTKPVYIEDDNLLVPAGIAVRKRDIQHLTSWGIYTVETDGEMVFPCLDKVGAAVPASTPGPASAAAPVGTPVPVRAGVPASAGVPVGAGGVASQSSALAASRPQALAVSGNPAAAVVTRTVTTAPNAPRPSVTGGGASGAAPVTRVAAPAGPIAGQPAEAPKKTISAGALKEAQGDQGVVKSYLKLINQLQGIFDQISAKMPLEDQDLDHITSELLQAVREQKGQIVGCVLGSEVEGRELAKRSVNTAIMAARTAIALRLPPHKLMQLTIAALLHDAGMLRISPAIVEKQENLTEEETKILQSHVSASYHIICKEFSYPNDVGMIAWQHHERWDGQGYPRKVSGSQINAYARILTVASAFESMVREKSDRNSYEAMRNLLADSSHRFDPDVVKAFVRTMGIYPIGSIVSLNNNSIARVTEVKAAAPLTPVVRVLIDERGRVLKSGEEVIIDLQHGKGLFITRALDPRLPGIDKAPA